MKHFLPYYNIIIGIGKNIALLQLWINNHRTKELHKISNLPFSVNTWEHKSRDFALCLCCREATVPVYQLERDSVTKKVHFEQIALLESQRAELMVTADQRAASASNFNDLSLGKIRCF